MAEQLRNIHSTLQFANGSLTDEYEEQMMSVTYIKADDRVLEIGGDVGRNSCVIGRLLKDGGANMVVFEPGISSANKLCQNRDVNGLKFNIECSAISNIPLVHKNWDTRPYTQGYLNDGWTPVPVLSWKDVKAKYNIPFNTLVVDCEGALYYILKEEPNFLDGFEKILIENDFVDIEHKRYVDAIFTKFGFNRVYVKSGGFGPCGDRFYEAWAT